jgi:alanine racemase
MDMIGVDVTHLTEEPNFLNLFHATQSIDTIADHAQTIGYEILTSFGSRYRRSYRA